MQQSLSLQHQVNRKYVNKTREVFYLAFLEIINSFVPHRQKSSRFLRMLVDDAKVNARNNLIAFLRKIR